MDCEHFRVMSRAVGTISERKKNVRQRQMRKGSKHKE